MGMVEKGEAVGMLEKGAAVGSRQLATSHHRSVAAGQLRAAGHLPRRRALVASLSSAQKRTGGRTNHPSEPASHGTTDF